MPRERTLDEILESDEEETETEDSTLDQRLTWNDGDIEILKD